MQLHFACGFNKERKVGKTYQLIWILIFGFSSLAFFACMSTGDIEAYGTDWDAGTDTDADADTDSHSDTDTDTDSDTDTDTDSDTCTVQQFMSRLAV